MRCILESLRYLEITNIESDREIQKVVTDETELEKDLEKSLKFSLKIKRYKKQLEIVLQQQGKFLYKSTYQNTKQKTKNSNLFVKNCTQGNVKCHI